MPEWFKPAWRKLQALFHRKQLDRDLEDEIAFHLAMREAKNQSEGRDPEHRLTTALIQFGNPTRFKERCREMWTFASLESFLQDLRYGIRLLRKNPGFTFVAVLTLALGIGANTAIFSLTYQVLLQRLPVPHPEELVLLRSPGLRNGHVSSDSDNGANAFSYPLYKELRDQNKVFSTLLARYPVALSVSGPGFSERAAGELVSGNYFETLGVRPALGRLFSRQDETTAGADTMAVLSYGYWTRRFANSLAILNKQLTVNGVPLTVVGVASEGFIGVQIGQTPDIFLPITLKALATPGWDGLEDPKDYWLEMLARLNPGLTEAQAQAALQPTYYGILQSELPLFHMRQKTAELFLKKKMFLDPGSHGRTVLQSEAKQLLLFLLAIVGLVLVIACANLAGLLIAKGEARQQEMAVRLSLGARRGRLVRQLLSESLLLAIAGGTAGLVIALLVLRLIVHSIPQGFGAAGLEANPDYAVLLFVAAISMTAAVFFGLAPALRVTRTIPDTPLVARGIGSASMANVRLRKWLMVFQVAVTAVLLTGAALFTASLIRLQYERLGLQTDHVLQFAIAPGMSRYSPAQTVTLADELRKRIAALPGVTSASAAEVGVFTGHDVSSNITIQGYVPKENEDMNVGENWVGPDYLSTMGISLLRGREFNESDSAAAPKVAMINEAMARRWFAGRDALGQIFCFGAGDVQPDIQIIGIIGNSKHAHVRGQPMPFVYLPYAQHDILSQLTFYVRTGHDSSALSATITQLIASFDSGLPVYNMKPLVVQVNESVFSDLLATSLSVSLGLLAAFLAAIGLYGVMAYVVTRRTKEIGIRMALGATRQGISWLILREVVQMAAAGLAIGLIFSIFGGHLIKSLLFGVTSTSPTVLAITAGLLLVVTLFAGGLPARKAAKVDPMIALRYE